MATYDWLNRALDGDPVWNLGQLSEDDIRVLNQAVRAGKLLKDRVSWRAMSPIKTVWYREDRPPQEVMRKQYYAGIPAPGKPATAEQLTAE